MRYDHTAKENLKKAKVSMADLQQLHLILKKNQTITLEDFIKYVKQKIPDLYQKKNIFIRVKSALAIAYYVHQNKIPKVSCLVSDNAPEYNKIAINSHALCWVHDARYYKKLNPALEVHRKKRTAFMDAYWKFYRKLLEYKKAPGTKLSCKITADFDVLFSTKTSYFQLDKLINKTFKKEKSYLLCC